MAISFVLTVDSLFENSRFPYQEEQHWSICRPNEHNLLIATVCDEFHDSEVISFDEYVEPTSVTRL